MKIKYLTLFLVAGISSLFGALLFVAPVQSAVEPTSLSNVTLWIYPEYDDPRLLVMLEGQISGVSAPARIRFLVPEAAEMFSAGSKDSQGKYSGGPPDRTASQISGWDEISYDLTNNTFRVEYYDPIIKGQIEKNIAYDFISLYPINSLEVIIQVPTAATNFLVAPQGIKTVEGNFTVYSSRYTSLPANQTLHFDIRYSKSDPNPSLGSAPVSNQGTGSWNPLPFMIFGGVIIVVGALIWAIKATRKDRKIARIKVKNKQKSPGKPKPLPSKFCNQCGKRLELPSKFCPYCRHKLED